MTGATGPRVTLVLGAGGVVGMAYHAGVLAALGEAGFDARRSSLVVGTSAGSVIGALLRAGLSPADMLASALGEPPSSHGAALAARAAFPDRMAARGPLPRVPRPAAPGLGLRRAIATRQLRPGVVLAGLLPAGSVPTESIERSIDALHPEGWPAAPFWVCALDLRTGERVVLGRDPEPTPSVGAAVAASCAIPGYFRPVETGGRRLVDGGAHSPTNADVATADANLVVVSSPMSATRAALRRPVALPSRRGASLALAGELAELRRSGATVLTFQPTPEDLHHVGGSAMDPERREPVARAALASARRRLATPEVAARLATVTRRRWP